MHRATCCTNMKTKLHNSSPMWTSLIALFIGRECLPGDMVFCFAETCDHPLNVICPSARGVPQCHIWFYLTSRIKILSFRITDSDGDIWLLTIYPATNWLRSYGEGISPYLKTIHGSDQMEYAFSRCGARRSIWITCRHDIMHWYSLYTEPRFSTSSSVFPRAAQFYFIHTPRRSYDGEEAINNMLFGRDISKVNLIKWHLDELPERLFQFLYLFPAGD